MTFPIKCYSSIKLHYKNIKGESWIIDFKWKILFRATFKTYLGLGALELVRVDLLI